ncbi:MAG: hypothetical protein JW730_09500 [Anaerolineales bacterium]|nr:hypothetical protein [Anaerolineales bacterium]
MAGWKRKIAEYEADLYRVQEPTLLNKLLSLFMGTKSGEIEMKKYEDGEKQIEIEVHSVNVPDGSTVSAVIDGATVHEFRVNHGRARLLLSTSRGDRIPEVHNGSVAEIRFSGEVLLRGTFRPD